jgi:GAF domain-containing protein
LVGAVRDFDALVSTLAGFAETLTHSFGIGDVLHDLTARITDVLSLTGAGVTLVEQDQVRFVTASVETISELERVQETLQKGPCVEAISTGRPVTVEDLAAGDIGLRWPEYAAQAKASGVGAVAAVPLQTGNQTLGALDLYNEDPRDWSTVDVDFARILGNVATSYLLHASALSQQQRLSEQLQEALTTRIIIEQAKGTLALARGISVDEAFREIRRYARHHNLRIHAVADAVVHEGLRP